MTALGAKEGSTSTKRYDWQTGDQKDLFKDTLEGYKNLDYKGPGSYNEGTKADELEGFKATSFDQLKKLKDEGRLSLEGLNKLRNYGATAATQVNPDIEALRGLGKDAWQGYDAHLSETVRGARKKLQAADISSRRGSGTGGTALTRAVGQNIGDYGKTVGEASARVSEESAYRRQQLAMQGRMQAGQLGLGATAQGLQGLQSAGQLELGELGLTAQDLAQRRGIHSQERQYEGQNELQRARYSGERADAKNLWNQTNAANENTWGLNRLRDQTNAATTRTFEDVVTKKAGSAGLGGALITAGATAAGAYFGGPAGAQFGSTMGNALVNSSGDYGGGGGGGPNYGNMGNMMNAGVNAYAAGGGFSSGGYNAPVPGRANNSWSSGSPQQMGYGGDYGEFGGGMAGSYNYGGGVDPSMNFGMNDDPMLAQGYGRQTFNPRDDPYASYRRGGSFWRRNNNFAAR